ncbi:MAG TPA: ATP-binding protein [Egibacteraceae bacterium]|nr:ATP-binding protein [Egibacteraceae bacterium]
MTAPPEPFSTVTADPSLVHFLRRMAIVESRVRAEVARRRAGDPEPDDPFRGLYVTDAHVDRLLEDGPGGPAADDAAQLTESVEHEADLVEAGGVDLRLRRLQATFDLDAFDVDLLLVAVAPDVDPRFERLYAYLNDDVSRRRASTGLALSLCGAVSSAGAARRRLTAAGPLVGGGLVTVEDADRPFLTRALRVPDRVVAHLLGDDAIDPVVAPLLAPAVDTDGWPQGPLEQAVAAGTRLCYLQEGHEASGRSAAVTALRRSERPPLVVDTERLEGAGSVTEVAAAAAREARLTGAGLVVGPVEALLERGAGAVRAFADCAVTIVLVGARAWDPAWSATVPLVLDAPVSDIEQRTRLWERAFDGDAAPDLSPTQVAAPFRLTPEQVVRAAATARLRAAAHGRALTAADLQAGARAQNSVNLERLARRVAPRATWEDLVLPADVLGALRELTARARHRDRVLDTWGMGVAAGRGRGVTALFAGDSGTGKTLSAEIVAGDLGLDLYVIDLSTVVDKYIGETEKNLDRIFAAADRVNGVLLFDEADALFGKRSEVSDARDRYANVEVAYLLQRMEAFDGVAVLTTNLRANLDEAFTRRLDAIVDFPVPEEDDRRRLWRAKLRAELPQEADIDLDFLARAFKLSGGEIRNIAVTAAYLAADAGRPVGMADVVRATAREYRKLGRLCLKDEFGPYHGLVGEPASA